MEHDLVVEGRVVAPGGIDEVQVGVSEGVIREIRRQGLRGARTIRARGCLVFPGFIDGHVHLREPGWEYKEDFASGTAAAVHGGVTTVVDMPNNPVPATTRETLAKKRRLADAKGHVDVRLHGGVLGSDVAALREVKDLVVGYKIYLARSTGGLVFPVDRLGEAMRAVEPTGRPLSLHCEDQQVIDSREAALAGEKRQDLYCDIRPPEAEVSSVEATLAALRANRALRMNVCHASTSGTISAVSAARTAGLRVACEAALHHVFFSRKAALGNPLLRTNPPLRREGDRATVVEGLRTGKVNFLVTDHAPHTREEKLEEGMSGVPGLDDYGHVVSWLLKAQGFGPNNIASVCSENPAAYYGLPDRGEIAVGKRADFAILDMGTPERVSGERLMTKCGWSPYEGVEFPGRVRWTIRGGEALLEDFEMSL